MSSRVIGPALPEAFKARMREILLDDFDRFIDSFDDPRTRGLRINPAKVGVDELQTLLGVDLDPLPWSETGFALPPDVALGGHPAHLSGLFYLQDPSAMTAAQAMDPQPGWSVIDLAAAPGGKTTHLASLLGSDGLVVANEVVAGRLRPLHDNLDLWGLANVVTTSLPIDQIAASGARFDAALLDAPCSGEALFRRDPSAVRHWSVNAVEGAARRQRDLLANAAQIVRPGGVLVYSTCSFGLIENEHQIFTLLEADDAWILEDCAQRLKATPGVRVGEIPTDRTARFWPHTSVGDGQFIARLRRRSGRAESVSDADRSVRGDGPPPVRAGPGRGSSRRAIKPERLLEAWAALKDSVAPDFDAPSDHLIVRNDRLFLAPGRDSGMGRPMLTRPGLPLGRLRPGRFEPHPGLATALDPALVVSSVSWTEDQPQLQAYLRGETVADPGPDGVVLVCYRRWGLGWARRSRGVLKNLFPQHLRRQGSAHLRRTP